MQPAAEVATRRFTRAFASAKYDLEQEQRKGGDPMVSGISKSAMVLLGHAGVGATSSEG
jgi:hypothetical protein